MEAIIDRENTRLREILEEISGGLLEGMRDGFLSGVKQGAADGLKESIAGGFGNIGTVDMGAVLDEALAGAAKKAVRESARAVFSKITEPYIRAVIDRVMSAAHQRTGLTDEQIGEITAIVMKKEREIAGKLMTGVPDNPFCREIAEGIREALEENLEAGLRQHRNPPA